MHCWDTFAPLTSTKLFRNICNPLIIRCFLLSFFNNVQKFYPLFSNFTFNIQWWQQKTFNRTTKPHQTQWNDNDGIIKMVGRLQNKKFLFVYKTPQTTLHNSPNNNKKKHHNRHCPSLYTFFTNCSLPETKKKTNKQINS